MIKVHLLGDSIRQGYSPYIKKELQATVVIYEPLENCRSSQHLLDKLPDYLAKEAIDLIHLNCGLHDIRRNRVSGEIAVPLASYEKNLEGIFSYISKHFQCPVIWASTTPVNEQQHQQHKA